MLIQLRFRGRGPLPDRRQVEAWGRAWISGGAIPDWLRIEPIVWKRGALMTETQARAHLAANGAYFGCPGVVRWYGSPHLVMMDYDGAKPPTILETADTVRVLGLTVEWIEDHQTARGWHRVVSLREKLSPAILTALQAIWGSDPKRETFNLARVLSGHADKSPRWNLLFERKL